MMGTTKLISKNSSLLCTEVYSSVRNDKYSTRLRNRILYSRLQAKQKDLSLESRLL